MQMNVNFITSTTDHIIVSLQPYEKHCNINKQGTIYTISVIRWLLFTTWKAIYLNILYSFFTSKYHLQNLMKNVFMHMQCHLVFFLAPTTVNIIYQYEPMIFL